jgi:sugar phosphate isomerase/epimerase
MRIGVCAQAEAARQFASGVVDYIEVSAPAFLKPEAPESAFEASLALLDEMPAPVEAANCFIIPEIKTTGPDVDDERLRRYVRTACVRAGRAGIAVIVFGSGGSRQVPDGFAKEKALCQLIDRLKQWGDWAGENGVTLAIEPLNRAECNIINSVAEGQELAEKVGRESVRLLVDFYHLAKEHEPLDHVIRAGYLLRHAHIAEAAERTFPGAKGDDFRPAFRALKAAGYSGRVSLECGWGDLPAEVAGSVAYLRRQSEEAGI